MKHKLTLYSFILLSLGFCFPLSASELIEGDLGNWLLGEAIPAFETQLKQHPRFRGQSIKLSAMHNGRIWPIENKLTEMISEEITLALVNSAGTRILLTGNQSCTAERPDLILGIEVEKRAANRYQMTLAIVDPHENIWVNGTVHSWTGRLDKHQRQALEQLITRPAFPRNQVNALATALVSQLDCAPELALPVFIQSGNHDGQQDIVAAIQQQLANSSFITLEEREAATHLRLDRESNKLILHHVKRGQSIGQLATLDIRAVAGRVPDEKLISTLQVDQGSRHCRSRKEVCVELGYEVYKSAYVQTIVTRSGQLSPLSCEFSSRVGSGSQSITLRVPQSEADNGAALGVYVLATEDRKYAERLHDVFRQASRECGNGVYNPDALATLLANKGISWQAAHLNRDGYLLSADFRPLSIEHPITRR